MAQPAHGSNNAGSTWWNRWGFGCRATRSTPSPGTTPDPDFFYQEANAAIYIDGPPHDAPAEIREDEAMTRTLIEAGYIVIRFHHGADWLIIFRRRTDVFGLFQE